MFKKIIPIFAILAFTPMFAHADGPADSGKKQKTIFRAHETTTSKTATIKKGKEKPYTVNLGTAHNVGFKKDANSFTEFNVNGEYKLNEKHNIQLTQTAIKLYEIPKHGEKEFQLEDTSIYHIYTISPDFHGFDIKWRTGLTLPISEFSRTQGVITKPSGTLMVSKALMDNTLSLGYSPFFRYHFNEYDSSISGTPHVASAVGQQLQGSYQVLPKVTLSASMAYVTEFYDKHPKTNKTPPADGKYSYQATASYEISKNIGASIGYGQSDSYIKDGVYEMYLYDPEQSRLSLGLDFKF